jgi:hypothetical protein
MTESPQGVILHPVMTRWAQFDVGTPSDNVIELRRIGS